MLLTPSTTTAPELVVEKAIGVCSTTNPGTTLPSGNGRTCVRNPARCSCKVALDWESPITFGTVTVVRTVDVVEEGGIEVEAAVEGAGEVDGGPFAALLDCDPEV